MSLRVLLGEDNLRFANSFMRSFQNECLFTHETTPKGVIDTWGMIKCRSVVPQYDLIITDLSYTEEHKREGYEVIRTIRQYDQEVPILLQTGASAEDMAEILQKASMAGANYIFSKSDLSGVRRVIQDLQKAKEGRR